MTVPPAPSVGPVRPVWSRVASPLGELLVERDELGLTALYLPTGRHSSEAAPASVRDDSAFDDARAQLGEYFAGERTEFDLPLHLIGSAFQRRVWAQLLDIRYGTTTSYGAIARTLGSVNGSRAVGLANGQNPISIIVPCHRVIGANGSLTGYGGGLPAKQWLLSHEVLHAGLFAI